MQISEDNEAMFRFIREHIDDDVNKLRLKRYPQAEFDVDFAITQIECRKRIRRKLPEIYDDGRFLFPSLLSTEQATCETIAKYHAAIVGEVDCVLDMTAGLCIDDYYIANVAKHVVSIELNETIAAVSRYNMSRLRSNIEVVQGNSIDYITSECVGRRFDAVFVDPARRASNQSRVYGLADCEPDILSLLPALSRITPILYVKASPMLDVTQVLRDVPGVTDVWIVSLRNECKELFFKVDFAGVEPANDVVLHCVNFAADELFEELSLPYSALRLAVDSFAQSIDGYVYEPNASIMKAGAFAAVSEKYGVSKIATHSHLFTANELCKSFPGRVYEVECVLPFKEKSVKSALKGVKKMNVSVRNFKLTAEQLKNRLKLSDGGDKYLIGTTTADGSMVVILCNRVQV